MAKTVIERWVAELDQEFPTTRRVLERVPDGRFDWQPHAKSMSLGRLAGLVASMPGWVAMMLTTDQFDVAAPGNRPPEAKTSKALVDTFDANVAKTREALRNASDAQLETTWRMLAHGHVVNESTRYESIRTGVINHLAHHRGQLTVYLRLLDVPVPSIYGPTADENAFG
jgi:uncharacterized damage-inducible protein DinB